MIIYKNNIREIDFANLYKEEAILKVARDELEKFTGSDDYNSFFATSFR